jgi:hypothetical protein
MCPLSLASPLVRRGLMGDERRRHRQTGTTHRARSQHFPSLAHSADEERTLLLTRRILPSFLPYFRCCFSQREQRTDDKRATDVALALVIWCQKTLMWLSHPLSVCMRMGTWFDARSKRVAGHGGSKNPNRCMGWMGPASNGEMGVAFFSSSPLLGDSMDRRMRPTCSAHHG